MTGVQKPRWEPWPVGIAAFLFVFVSCIAAFITFAVRQQMDLVRPDYYEEEIRYQVQFDRLERTRALGVSARVTADAGRGVLEVGIPSAHAAALTEGTIQFYRPSDAVQDRVVPLKPSAEGVQTAGLGDLGPGLWRVRVRWASGGKEYAMDDSFVMPATR
jgi:nitrogen fixation protein FixH